MIKYFYFSDKLCFLIISLQIHLALVSLIHIHFISDSLGVSFVNPNIKLCLFGLSKTVNAFFYCYIIIY